MLQRPFDVGYGYVEDHHAYWMDASGSRGSSTERQGLLALFRVKDIEASKWREKARYLDVIRGTYLGTLGYLPLEIRYQIWQMFFTFNYCPPVRRYCNKSERRTQHQVAANLPREPQIFWSDRPRYSLHDSSWRDDDFVNGNSLKPIIFSLERYSADSKISSCHWRRHWELQWVSKSVREEMEAVFFLTHQFTFRNPFEVISFCGLLPPGGWQCLRHISLWLCVPHWPWQYDARISDREFENQIETWKDSVRHLPETVTTVLVNLDGRGKMGRELDLLRAIVETFRRVAKEAVVTICKDGDYGELTKGRLAAYQEVVDCTRGLHSRDTEIDRYSTEEQDQTYLES